MSQTATSAPKNGLKGLAIERRFSSAGTHPFDEVEWEIRDAVIGDPADPAFEQRGVEFPKSWSQNATNIVAQKYFRGQLGSEKRERSVKEMVGRVAGTISGWGREGGYFASEQDAAAFEAELTSILLNQKAAFNSPVWFNVGFEERPQCSACQPHHALVSTPEGMVPIGELVEGEQVGREVYDANGVTRVVAVKANGRKPVMRVKLRNGGFIEATPDHVVKAVSERRTKPQWLRVDQLKPGMRLHLHPHRARVADRALVAAGGPAPAELDGADQVQVLDEATRVDRAEAALAGWLQADGFVGQYESGTNTSLTIEFQVAGDDEYAWVMENLEVALPGVHRKVRVADTQEVEVRRIRLYGELLRDFVERWGLFERGTEIRVPSRLWAATHEEICAYLRSVFQADGYMTVGHRGGYENARIGFAVIGESWTEDLQILLNSIGIHSRRARKQEKRGNRHDLHELSINIGSERVRFAELIGFVSEEKQSRLLASLELRNPKVCPDLREEEIVAIEELGVEEVYDIQTESGEYLSNNVAVHNCFILSVEDNIESILEWNTKEGRIFRGGSGSGINLSNIRGSMEPLAKGGTASGPVSFMRGADAWAGTIKSGGKTRRAAKMVVLDVDHPDIEHFVWCKADEEKKAAALRDAGFDMSIDGEGFTSIQYQNANNSVRVTDEFMEAVEAGEDWDLLARTTGDAVKTLPARELMNQVADAAWRCADPGVQYDSTIQRWHTDPNTGRITASNPCSEYLSIDDSACNLASLNLMRFRREDGSFDIEDFEHAIDIVFLAQEILVGYSSYPTPEITKNANDYRQLGLGYANLGALLMADGVPYDSDEGRNVAAAITGLMTGRAYRKSAEIASVLGPYEGYEKNREPHNGVMRMHRDAAYDIDPAGIKGELLEAARRAWDGAVELGEERGYRNAQATVLAPTGCLVGDSLIATSRGLVRLNTLGDTCGPKWQDLDIEVATDEGPRPATDFYVNGFEQVVSIETGRGYRIQGTPTHRIKVVDTNGEWVWRRFAEIEKGDRVPMMLNGIVGEPQDVPLPPLGELHWNADFRTRVPRAVTPELAELVGYFMGDGSLHAKGLRLCVAAEDRDVVDRIVELGGELFGISPKVSERKGYTEVAYNSVPLAIWWEACGFSKLPPSAEHSGKGWHAHVPNAILHSNDSAVYAAFVRGLWEADGTTTNGYASWSTVTERFSRDVQSLMLALGFVTTRKVDGTDSNWGANERYVLRILNVADATRFADEIGFISKRKSESLRIGEHRQASRHDHIPVSRELIDELAPANDSLRKTMLMALSRRGDVSRRSATALLERTESPELEHLLNFFYDDIAEIEVLDDQPTFDLSVPDNVTYVANGFVSHNTISFLMDCDTTGVEPDFSLVKYKELVGGGQMTIVNRSVPLALRTLGYSDVEVDQIDAHVAEKGTIVGAPGLKDEHLPVFDVAVGERAIHHNGHIDMMGAVQPMISGAISKTVNMPQSATVEDIADAYTRGWKGGLKALAIYRDGSKTAQALRTDAQDEKQAEGEAVAAPVRKRMPRERESITHKFSIAGHEGYITAGKYEDGSVGEIFLTDIGKEGSTMRGLLNAFATAISIGLQYGVPLDVFVRKFSYMRFEPEGITQNPEIPFAKSMPDYIMRWVASRFIDDLDELEDLGILTTEVRAKREAETSQLGLGIATGDTAGPANGGSGNSDPADGAGAAKAGRGNPAPAASAFTETPPVVPAKISGFDLGPACDQCGGMMQRTGSCYTCPSCGNNTGCG